MGKKSMQGVDLNTVMQCIEGALQSVKQARDLSLTSPDTPPIEALQHECLDGILDCTIGQLEIARIALSCEAR